MGFHPAGFTDTSRLYISQTMRVFVLRNIRGNIYRCIEVCSLINTMCNGLGSEFMVR